MQSRCLKQFTGAFGKGAVADRVAAEAEDRR
jgi:hypothetical protein